MKKIIIGLIALVALAGEFSCYPARAKKRQKIRKLKLKTKFMWQ